VIAAGWLFFGRWSRSASVIGGIVAYATIGSPAAQASSAALLPDDDRRLTGTSLAAGLAQPFAAA